VLCRYTLPYFEFTFLHFSTSAQARGYLSQTTAAGSVQAQWQTLHEHQLDLFLHGVRFYDAHIPRHCGADEHKEGYKLKSAHGKEAFIRLFSWE
jgi:hypothetical protein